jgi:hypothetical protein
VVDALSLEVSDNLAVARLDPADLREHWRRLNLSGVDALVLSACVQMPSLAAIQPVEDEAGLPVLSAATATTYRILTELGLPTDRAGAGSLLAGRVPVAVRQEERHPDQAQPDLLAGEVGAGQDVARHGGGSSVTMTVPMANRTVLTKNRLKSACVQASL